MAGRKRGYGEDSIYFDHVSECRDSQHHRTCLGRWRGSVSLGFGPDAKRLRRKVSGRTKTEVKDKLHALHDELRDGIRSSPTYTVQNAVDDWLAHGLDGRSAKTISTNQEVLAPLTALIGAAKLRELTAADVRSALARLAATRSTRTIQIARNGLVRAIRHAEANDLVSRNVAALVTAPRGLEGRPSKSLSLQLSGPVASDPVVSRLIAALAADAPRALKAIRAARAAARERAWALAGGTAPGAGGGLIVLDVDATIVTACSEKEQAAPTWKKTFGFHPLTVFAATGRKARVSRWPSCCGQGTPGPTPPPATSRRCGSPWPSCPRACSAAC